MRLSKYIIEATGSGITFIDLDETLFHTFAKVHVVKGGKKVKALTNQEYNTHQLKDNEKYDYGEFKNAKLFRKTSIPVKKTVKRMKKMLKGINESGSESRILILTARTNFNDKEEFLSKFKDHGLDLRKEGVYVERNSRSSDTSISSEKKAIIDKYIKGGKYERVRLIDDSIDNIKAFLELQSEYPSMKFFGLLVKKDGTLKRVK